MTLRRSVRVVLALRAHDLGDLELHQLMHDAEPGAHAQRQQPLPRRADKLTERLLNRRGEQTLRRLDRPDDLRHGYLQHGGSSFPGLTSDTRNAANGNGRGGRTAAQTSTRSRTTS
jgi:hypothetical protein